MSESHPPPLRILAERQDLTIDSGEPVLIGRSSANTVRLTNPFVSRQHAQLRADDDEWVFEDLGSRRGSYISEHAVRRFRVDRELLIHLGGPELGAVIRVIPQPICQIFLSYRRADGGYGGRLGDNLLSLFTHGEVFVDTEDISIGEDYLERIRKAMSTCKIVLVVVGPNWRGPMPDHVGRCRLESADDPVRQEVETALSTVPHVVPILVGDAQIEASMRDLPASMRQLALRQAQVISSRHWHSDVERLVTDLRRLLV